MIRFMIFSVLLLTGCSGTIYTIENPDMSEGKKLKGIIVYQPSPLVLVTETTHLQDKKGDIVGSAEDKKCIPTRAYEITSIPDYGKKYLVGYRPGLFETNKFAIELNNGVITKINTESTSTATSTLELTKGIIEGVTGLAEVGIKIGAPALPSCNVGKKLIGRKAIEDIPTVH